MRCNSEITVNIFVFNFQSVQRRDMGTVQAQNIARIKLMLFKFLLIIYC